MTYLRREAALGIPTHHHLTRLTLVVVQHYFQLTFRSRILDDQFLPILLFLQGVEQFAIEVVFGLLLKVGRVIHGGDFTAYGILHADGALHFGVDVSPRLPQIPLQQVRTSQSK